MSDQYFSVPHRLPLNVTPLVDDSELPTLEQLDDEIPDAFKLASEVSTVDSGTARALRNMGDTGDEIAAFLEQQARKINVIMGYILSMQDDPELRHHTVSFGASEFIYESDKAVTEGSYLQVKLFLHDEASAVYAYAQVTGCESVEEQFHVSAKFCRLRESDHELLIRATLHVQSKLLKKRAEKRKGEDA
ncbi:PilZ domain-containing protein [Corallincola platygyrae]|uniref:PilZ domain-containing protein n=1 Tax=Corallincola platygyrae TaxID=1193278 RepID=A0ABW4XP63_9GAMM